MIRLPNLLARYQDVNWGLADQGMVSGVNFLTNILLVRHVGLHEFGVFTLALTALRFVTSIQQALIIAPMTAIGPKQEPADEPAYFSVVLFHQVSFAVVSTIVLFLGMLAAGVVTERPGFGELALPLAVATLAFQLQDFVRRRFFCRQRASWAFANDVISYLGQLGLLLVLFEVTQLDSTGVLWTVAATSGVAAAIGLIGSGRGPFDSDTLRAVTRRHWHFSKWVLVNTQLDQFGRYPLTWALAAILGSKVVGAVQAAGNVLGLLHVLFFGLNNVIQPAAARLVAREGVSAALRFLRQMTLVTGVPVLLICAAVGLFPGPIVSLLYGPELKGWEPVVALFSVAYFITFLKKPLVWLLMATEHPKAVAASQAAESVTAAVLCVPAIMLFGVPGLMGLIIGSAVLSVLVLLIQYRRIAPTVRGHVES